MVSYRLIKKYPSLPEDWEVGMELGIGDYKYNFSPCNSKYTDKELSNSEVRNNPEFWEKVVEKDYEILSIKKVSGKNPKGLDKWTPNVSISLQAMLEIGACVNSGDYYINSVKRLSDGEIFTIGDKVDENVTGTKYPWVISEFSLKDTRCFTCGVNITCIEKVKTPLFTTEDGVDIYEGDEFFRVWYKDLTMYPHQTFANKEYCFTLMNKSAAHFSTQKAAENYIKCNKPVLSYNDVLKLYDDCGSHADHRQYYKKQLTKLVESKI